MVIISVRGKEEICLIKPVKDQWVLQLWNHSGAEEQIDNSYKKIESVLII